MSSFKMLCSEDFVIDSIWGDQYADNNAIIQI